MSVVDEMDQRLVELIKKVELRMQAGREQGWTPDNVHDYRVAIRRARSYLKFWRCEFPGRQKLLRDQLRALQQQTALVREWDVFLESFRDVLTDESIKKGEFARFVQIQGWIGLEKEWAEVLAKAEKLQGNPAEDRQKRLRRRLIREANGEELDWHRLRIRVKQLRYELERQIEADEEIIQALKDWQDRLGLIQDAQTHRKWFGWLGEEDGMISLGNQATYEKLVEESKRDLPRLLDWVKK